MEVITHRGIDAERKDFPMESSYGAFIDHLKRGYGLEFDLQMTNDDHIVVSHDANLKRLSEGTHTKNIQEMSLNEFLQIRIYENRFVSLDELLSLIDTYRTPHSIYAVHLKGNFQTLKNLGILAKKLLTLTETNHLIFFDVTIQSAHYLKGVVPSINLAPSIVDSYDKERYAQFTQNTLYTFNDIEGDLHLFSHVWFDEWDRKSPFNELKKLYSEENFERARSAGLKICLVSPELHGSSPGLLGAEMHEDAHSLDALKTRVKEMINLGPDAICTDYPDMVRTMSANHVLV